MLRDIGEINSECRQDGYQSSDNVVTAKKTEFAEFLSKIQSLGHALSSIRLKFRKWTYTSDLLLKPDTLKQKIEAYKHHRDKTDQIVL